MEQTAKFDTWGIVEVMGHRKYAGRITEQLIAGAALVRIDVPAAVSSTGDSVPEYSKFVGVGSVYMITPTTEDVARRAAAALARWENTNPIPVALPLERQLAAGGGTSSDDRDFDFDDEQERR